MNAQFCWLDDEDPEVIPHVLDKDDKARAWISW